MRAGNGAVEFVGQVEEAVGAFIRDCRTKPMNMEKVWFVVSIKSDEFSVFSNILQQVKQAKVKLVSFKSLIKAVIDGQLDTINPAFRQKV